MNTSLIDSLFKKTIVKDGHWLWIGAVSGNGYGYYRNQRVHRLSVSIYHRVDYNGDWLACHICDEELCWNPLHLYVGDSSTNTIDTVRKGTFNNQYTKATHCVNGHEFTKENTYTYLTKNGKLFRQCRQCVKGRLYARRNHMPAT